MSTHERAMRHAYDMGRDSIVNGPSTANCHFALFSTVEYKNEWERGRRDAQLLATERKKQQRDP